MQVLPDGLSVGLLGESSGSWLYTNVLNAKGFQESHCFQSLISSDWVNAFLFKNVSKPKPVWPQSFSKLLSQV